MAATHFGEEIGQETTEDQVGIRHGERPAFPVRALHDETL
jgi:hypothetical protein